MKWKDDSDSLTIYLSGEIDHCAAEKLRDGIEKLIERSDAETLILDFHDVSFMDSSGVGMLIGRYKTMAERGGCVFARGMQPTVRRVFYMAGLHRIIEEQEPEGGGEK